MAFSVFPLIPIWLFATKNARPKGGNALFPALKKAAGATKWQTEMCVLVQINVSSKRKRGKGGLGIKGKKAI